MLLTTCLSTDDVRPCVHETQRLSMCLEISAAYSTTSVNTQILSCSPVDPGRMRRNVSVTFTISLTWSFWHCSKAQFTWWNRCTYIY